MLGHTKLTILGLPVLALCAASQGAGFFDSHESAAQSATVSTDDDDDGDEVDPRDLADAAEITLSRAITLALAARPGSAVEAELEPEGKGASKEAFYEVKIVGTDKQLHEVKLSLTDGAVLGQEIEDDADAARELKAYTEVLRHTERTLAQLVDGASTLINGKPVYAGLEFDDGGPECEVLVVNGRYLVEVELEGRAGHVTELELRGMRDDDDHDEVGDDEEHDQHHGRAGNDDDDDDDHDSEDGEDDDD